MKTTTTLIEYLSSELAREGISEFVDNHQIISRDKRRTYIKKIMIMDDDVYNILNDRLFIDFKLEDEKADRHFKRTFCNKFLEAEIKYQTIETTASKILYVCLANEVFLNEVYSNLLDYINDVTLNNNKGNSKTVSDNRTANSELPANEVNVNVDNLVLNYADNNAISRYKSDTENNNDSEAKKKDLNNLLKSINLLDSLFNTFDKNCFLQTW